MTPGKWCVSPSRGDRKAHWFRNHRGEKKKTAVVLTSVCGLKLLDRTTEPLGSPIANDYPKCARCTIAEMGGI